MLEIKFTVDLSDRVMSAIEELTRSVRSTKSPAAPIEEVPNIKSPAAPKAEAPKAEASTNLKVEDVRALLRVKVNNDLNRDKLKTKLESYGAANVTALAKEHYDDFYKFMQTLP